MGRIDEQLIAANNAVRGRTDAHGHFLLFDTGYLVTPLMRFQFLHTLHRHYGALTLQWTAPYKEQR